MFCLIFEDKSFSLKFKKNKLIRKIFYPIKYEKIEKIFFDNFFPYTKHTLKLEFPYNHLYKQILKHEIDCTLYKIILITL